MIWTPEQKARLAELWAEGVPTAEIASQMGRTKNSVIGQANTLGLPTHPNIRSGGRLKGQRNRIPTGPVAVIFCDQVPE